MPWESPSLSGLQISERVVAQRRGEIGGRLAWVLMALVVAAAVLGLFGRGLMSTASVAGGDGLVTVTYDRFGRYGADSVVEVQVGRAAFEGDRLSVTVDRGYLESMKIDNISPQPLEETLSGAEATYTFAAPNAPTATVRFDMTPADVGSLDATLGFRDDSAEVSFSQFIYP